MEGEPTTGYMRHSALMIVGAFALYMVHLQASESYVTGVPVEVLRVTVQHPPELRVDVMSLHPDEVECICDNSTTKLWRLNGLLPGQGVTFWWRPASHVDGMV